MDQIRTWVEAHVGTCLEINNEQFIIVSLRHNTCVLLGECGQHRMARAVAVFRRWLSQQTLPDVEA